MIVNDPPERSAFDTVAEDALPPVDHWLVTAPASAAVKRLPRGLRHEWISAAALVLFDAAVWTLIYRLITEARGSSHSESPLQFFVLGALQFGIISQALFIIGGYDRHRDTRTLAYTAEHVLALAGAAAISMLLVYSAATFDQNMKPSRAVLASSFLVFMPLSLGYRRLVSAAVAASRASRAFLIIGSGDLAVSFYRAFRASGDRQRLEFVDVARERIGQHIAGPGTPIIEGNLETKLERLNDRYSGVILAERIDRLRPALLDQLVRTQFQRTRVYTLEGFYEAHWRYVPVQSLDPFWPLQMGFQLARISPYHYLKRLFDVIAAAVLLVLSAPLLLVIVLAVWLECGRPAIFHQTRVGRENHLFTVHKFRTMVRGSDSDDEDIYTRTSDPRITRIGRWLRKLRLDELPQLWNVLRGHMSLIGPRAEWIKCAERYEKIIPFYHFRHLVKPGITGWAQVNYPYGESDEDAIEKLKYDLYYIRHYSLKLDAMIALKTIYTMLFGRGR